MRAELIRNANDGLLYILKEDGTYFLAEIFQDYVLKIKDHPEVTELVNTLPEYELKLFPTTDGTSTFFLIKCVKEVKATNSGGLSWGGGGGGGINGIEVDKDGVKVIAKAKILNFIGQLVTVAAVGTTQADITIKIPSMTTAARLALIPTTALIVEDTNVDMYFKWSTVTSSWSPF